MRYLYKGKTKIGKIHMKTKVDTSFITAGPEDIASGKKTINGNYEEITGTMDINEVLTELTSDATATAADITAGKIGYANGKRLVGTKPRSIAGTFMSNAVIDTYPVATGKTINVGDLVQVEYESTGSIRLEEYGNTNTIQFSQGVAYYTNIIRLSDNKAVLIYSDGGVYRNGLIKFISVSGIKLVDGDSFTFNSTQTDNIHAIKLTDNHILVAYDNVDSSAKHTGMCRIITLNSSYTEVTISEPVSFFDSQVSNINIDKLTDNTAIITYISYQRAYAQYLNFNLSDSTILFSNSQMINSNSTVSEIVSVSLSPYHIVAAYKDGSLGYICELTISNNNIIIGSPMLFSNDPNYINLVKMTDTKYLLIYADYTLNSTQARLIFYVRNNVRMLNNIKVNDRYFLQMKATYVFDNRVYVIFNDSSNSLKLSATYIATSADNRINSAIINPISGTNNGMYLDISPMFDYAIITTYNEYLNAPLYGYVQLSHISQQISPVFEFYINTSKRVATPATTASFHGIANTSGTSGEIIEIITPPVSIGG